MANYAVTDYVTGPDDVTTVVAALETYIETVDDTKTLHLVTVVGCARDSEVIGIVIHDA